MSVRFGSALAFVVAMCFASLVLLAQYQVNRQVYGGTYGPSPGSVRYAPQYLGATNYAPTSARMMPSEVRNYYSRSGATPSQIRTGYNAVGPMSPTGPASYISQAPTYGKQAGPTGNMVNPMVGSPVSVGSIRYAGAQPSNVGISVGAVSTGLTPGYISSPVSTHGGSSSNPFSQANQSIRYNR